MNNFVYKLEDKHEGRIILGIYQYTLSFYDFKQEKTVVETENWILVQEDIAVNFHTFKNVIEQFSSTNDENILTEFLSEKRLKELGFSENTKTTWIRVYSPVEFCTIENIIRIINKELVEG